MCAPGCAFLQRNMYVIIIQYTHITYIGVAWRACKQQETRKVCSVYVGIHHIQYTYTHEIYIAGSCKQLDDSKSLQCVCRYASYTYTYETYIAGAWRACKQLDDSKSLQCCMVCIIHTHMIHILQVHGVHANNKRTRKFVREKQECFASLQKALLCR